MSVIERELGIRGMSNLGHLAPSNPSRNEAHQHGTARPPQLSLCSTVTHAHPRATTSALYTCRCSCATVMERRAPARKGLGWRWRVVWRRGREVEGTVMARLMGHFSLRPTGIVWTIKERGIKIKGKALQPFLKAPSR